MFRFLSLAIGLFIFIFTSIHASAYEVGQNSRFANHNPLRTVDQLHTSSWDGRILKLNTLDDLNFEQYLDVLSRSQIIVLAEEHYHEKIQAAQARTIEQSVVHQNMAGQFTTAWEFLNRSDETRNQELFTKVVRNEITSLDFLNQTLGHNDKNSTYAEIIDVTAQMGGRLMSVNLSRAEKAPVLKGGLKALDPNLLPPDFGLGTLEYYSRFSDAMKHHVPKEKIYNYFVAQCLVDDVSAYTLTQNLSPLNFLVIGAFHADYGDGVARRLGLRSPSSNVLTVRFLDASNYTESELKETLQHALFGDLADIVYFVNEPKAGD